MIKVNETNFVMKKKKEFGKYFEQDNFYGLYVMGVTEGKKMKVGLLTMPYEIQYTEIEGSEEDIEWYVTKVKELGLNINKLSYSLVNGVQLHEDSSYYKAKKLGFKIPSKEEVKEQLVKYIQVYGVSQVMTKVQTLLLKSDEIKREKALKITNRVEECMDVKLLKQLGFTAIPYKLELGRLGRVAQTVYIKEIEGKGYFIFSGVIGMLFSYDSNNYEMVYNALGSGRPKYATTSKNISNIWLNVIKDRQKNIKEDMFEWIYDCIYSAYKNRGGIKHMKII